MRHNPCPRCGGQLFDFEDHEKSCLQCGYIEHRRDNPLLPRQLELGLDREGEPDTKGPR
jgi:uncharacterized protein (DUF983 family)